MTRGLVHFESIAWDGRVTILCVAVNSAIDAEGVFQSVSPKPSTVVKDAPTLMVDKDDFLILILVRKDGSLKFLGHEPGTGERDGFKFLTCPGVEQRKSDALFDECCEIGRLDHHFLIVGVALLEALDRVIEPDFVLLTNLGKVVLRVVGAGLTASDVKSGEKGPPRSRVLLE